MLWSSLYGYERLKSRSVQEIRGNKETNKVPQLVKASMYKTKTGRHFPQIVEVLEQIKGEADGK